MTLSGLGKEVLEEPFAGQLGHLVKGPWFIKEVSGSRDDDKSLGTLELEVGRLIERKSGRVILSDDEKGRGLNTVQIRHGKIETTAARDDRGDFLRLPGSGLKSGARPCACAEIAQFQSASFRLLG